MATIKQLIPLCVNFKTIIECSALNLNLFSKATQQTVFSYTFYTFFFLNSVPNIKRFYCYL